MEQKLNFEPLPVDINISSKFDKCRIFDVKNNDFCFNRLLPLMPLFRHLSECFSDPQSGSPSPKAWLVVPDFGHWISRNKQRKNKQQLRITPEKGI